MLPEYGVELDVLSCERPDHDQHKQNHCPQLQSHSHEIEGSVMLAQEEGEGMHNHRFATVTTQVIPLPYHSHKHTFVVNTDFYDHLHEVAGETGPAVNVGNGKHVHYAKGVSTCNDNHSHDFQFATFIESPLMCEHQ